ncbi:antirestriction protein, partial [Escherichia coli]|uniref:antirestriction protein n=1 Tax=Escherichia coli TaxID=562 RepID=UPI001FCE5370
ILTFQNHTDCPLTDFGGKTSIFSHPVYLFLRKFSLQDSRGGSMNGNRAEMSPEAAGIAACLMTYSHHACRTECYAMTVHYYRLRDYALQHPECSAIMRIID